LDKYKGFTQLKKYFEAEKSTFFLTCYNSKIKDNVQNNVY